MIDLVSKILALHKESRGEADSGHEVRDDHLLIDNHTNVWALKITLCGSLKTNAAMVLGNVKIKGATPVHTAQSVASVRLRADTELLVSCRNSGLTRRTCTFIEH